MIVLVLCGLFDSLMYDGMCMVMCVFWSGKERKARQARMCMSAALLLNFSASKAGLFPLNRYDKPDRDYRDIIARTQATQEDQWNQKHLRVDTDTMKQGKAIESSSQ